MQLIIVHIPILNNIIILFVLPHVTMELDCKATSSQSLVSGHTNCLKYMRAGGWLGLGDYD